MSENPPTMKLEYTKPHVRIVQGDTDVATICPAAPEFVILGTYEIIKKGMERDFPRQVRWGMLYVKPVNGLWSPSFPGEQMPVYAKRRVPSAVYDANFHPQDPTLLVASLTNAEVHFFRFIKRASILDRRVITELLPLGTAKVAELDEWKLKPLITQVRWLDMYEECGSPDAYTNTITVMLTATTSAFEVLTAKVTIPGIRSTFDPRLAHKPAALSCSRETVHWHENEAWTSISIPTTSDATSLRAVLFSGGDDSKLMTSTINLDKTSKPPPPSIDDSSDSSPAHHGQHSLSPPTPLWTDSKSHTAGITDILLLPPILPTTMADLPCPIPLLTGSYDDHLRLFTLNPHTYRRTPLQPHLTLKLDGGVWRIKLMDHYIIPHEPLCPTTPTTTDSTATNTTRRSLPPHTTHYILLIAAMHAGTRIVRLTHNPSHPTQPWSTTFTPHDLKQDSLIYTVDSRREWTSPFSAQWLTAQNHLDGALPIDVEEALYHAIGDKRRVHVDVTWAEDNPADKKRKEVERGGWKGRLDWQERVKWEERVGVHTVVSVGFYDRVMRVWEWRDEERKGAMDLREFVEGVGRLS